MMSGLFSVDYRIYVFVLHLSQKLHHIHIISRQRSRRRMPSARPEYEDEHRLFLQGIMAKGVLNNKEVHSLHEKVLKMCSIEMPEKRKDLIDLLAKNIRTINNEIEGVGLMIKKGVEEDTGESCFMLVNTESRAVGGSKFLATRVQSQFSPAELDYLRLTPFTKKVNIKCFQAVGNRNPAEWGENDHKQGRSQPDGQGWCYTNFPMVYHPSVITHENRSS